jgi:TetR/AcrR family transcriptional regulator, transcriptional repressor for nem operon
MIEVMMGFGVASSIGAHAGAERMAKLRSWAAMVGAVILARSVDDQALSDEILEETRGWIDANLSEPTRAA